MVTIVISAAFRGAALIRGRRIFQCGYPKLGRLHETWRLLEDIISLICKPVKDRLSSVINSLTKSFLSNCNCIHVVFLEFLKLRTPSICLFRPLFHHFLLGQLWNSGLVDLISLSSIYFCQSKWRKYAGFFFFCNLSRNTDELVFVTGNKSKIACRYQCKQI